MWISATESWDGEDTVKFIEIMENNIEKRTSVWQNIIGRNA